MKYNTMKYHYFLPIFCFLTLSLSISGCATSQDVDVLRADINRLLKESHAAKSDIENLKEKTAGVAKEESFNVVRMSQAEIQSQLSTLAGDVQKLNGRFDESKYFLEKTVKDSTAEMDLLKTQIAALENQIREVKERVNVLEGRTKQHAGSVQNEQAKEMAGKPGSQREGELSGDGKTVKLESVDDRVQQYEDAYGAFKDKHYKEAREKFEAFLKAFPNDPLADNAYFWIAETYYNEKDFEGAILAYETHLKKYPKSQKAPGAFLKQGLSFIEIGDKKTGAVILEQLIERYPATKEADLAKKQIARIKKTKK